MPLTLRPQDNAGEELTCSVRDWQSGVKSVPWRTFGATTGRCRYMDPATRGLLIQKDLAGQLSTQSWALQPCIITYGSPSQSHAGVLVGLSSVHLTNHCLDHFPLYFPGLWTLSFLRPNLKG